MLANIKSCPLLLDDLIQAASEWRIWLTLGTTDIIKRYRRSKFGQFWLTLSMLIVVLGLGAVWSGIFRTQIRDYVPYVAVNLVVWSLLVSLITESCNAFIEAEGHIRHTPIAKSAWVLRVISRNLFIFAHNILIVPIVFLLFWIPVNPSALLAVPGFLLVLLNGLWIGLLLATISARYRDVPQVVTSAMQVLFAVTPILFRIEQLDPHVQVLMGLNPLASFLMIIRDPLLGHYPSMQSWGIALGLLVVGFSITALVFARARNRIVYWL